MAESQQKLTDEVYPKATAERLELPRKFRGSHLFRNLGDRVLSWFQPSQKGPHGEVPKRENPVNWDIDPQGTGICLSGGGIRSASYCLGALQAMESAGMLFGDKRAKYISAVSGGSYIATAFAMVARGRIEQPAKKGDPSIDPDLDPPVDGPDMRPFAPGTPEEQFLRDHTLYLTHGRGGVPGAVWRVLLGLMFNCTIVALSLSIFAIPLGWFYGWRWPALQAGCPNSCPNGPPFSIPTLLWWAVIAAGVATTVSGFVWLAARFKREWVRTLWGFASGVLVIAALVLLLFGVGIPELIHLARPFTGAQAVPTTAKTTKTATVAVASVGLFGLVVAWLATARRLVATPTSFEKGLAKVVVGFVERHKTFAINLVATIAGPVLVLAGIVILAYLGAAHPPGWSNGDQRWESFGWLGCVILLLVVLWRVDVTASSLYPIYRRNLSAAFVLGRTNRSNPKDPSPTAVDNEDAAERPYTISYRLSDCESDKFPEILICAAANISDYGVTPSGTNVTSFVFSSKWIGGPLVGAVKTTDYDSAIGVGAQSRFTTFPTAMAISGAAISPSMGKMTRPALRFFLALANLRLGVWVPNPRRLAKFENRRRHQILPRPQYLLREMLGRNHLDAPFLYVTDGGHYENLGLVELLRRKCDRIWCIDASGDQIDTFDTIGGALRTASAELGVSIAIDPKKAMAPPPRFSSSSGPRYVKSPFCEGKITYADKTQGSIVIVKAGVPNNAPWSVRSYLAEHPAFPCDPTLDQLYDADRFEAYRALGQFSVHEAISALGP